MRRSRAFVVFGWFAHGPGRRDGQRAVPGGRAEDHDAGAVGPRDAHRTAARRFCRCSAKRDVPVFGSFIKPGGSARRARPAKPPARPTWSRWRATTAPTSSSVPALARPGDQAAVRRVRKPATIGPQCSMKTRAQAVLHRPLRVAEQGRASCPQYMASWYEAKTTCEGIGKRLCSDTEWTLACEGPEHQPYPYGDGYARDGERLQHRQAVHLAAPREGLRPADQRRGARPPRPARAVRLAQPRA